MCYICTKWFSNIIFHLLSPIDIHSHLLQLLRVHVEHAPNTSPYPKPFAHECIVRKIADRYQHFTAIEMPLSASVSLSYAISIHTVRCVALLLGHCQFRSKPLLCCYLSSIINPNAIIWLRSLYHWFNVLLFWIKTFKTICAPFFHTHLDFWKIVFFPFGVSLTLSLNPFVCVSSQLDIIQRIMTC